MHILRRLGLVVLASVVSMSPSVFAFEKDALVVWINNDKGFNGLAEVGDRFTADTGVRVIVQTQNDWPESAGDPANRFARVAATSEGPDIIIWAHDRFGNWINEGLLEPVQPSLDRYNELESFAWNAVTVGDAIYGYPIAMEAISLIYNKELVPRAPRTWDEVIALDKQLRSQGKRAILWPHNNVYFSWPLLTSAGGYSFKKEDNVYQLTDVGVDSRGAVRGLEMMRRLQREGVLQPDDANNWDGMRNGFIDGDVAMVIDGPWAWNQYRNGGVDFGLARFPQIDENSGFGRPFVGFLAGAVNRFSPNKDLAKQFLEDYVVVYEGVKAIDADKALGATANKALMAELEADLLIAHTFAMAATGETMPDIPEMKRFWSSMETALGNIMTTDASIPATMTSVGDRLRKLDEMKMWSRKHYLTDTE